MLNKTQTRAVNNLWSKLLDRPIALYQPYDDE
jgi:hypothetical protein